MKEQQFDPGWVSYLEAIGAFKEFDIEVLQEMASRIHLITLEPGETLFSQGDEAASMYVVIVGTLEAIIEGKDGNQVVVREMGSGSPVGEIGLLVGGKRSATIRAKEETTLAEFTTRDFEVVLVKHPQIREKLMRLVLLRLRRSLLAKVLPDYFGDMNESLFDEIESRFEWVHINRGDSLFLKGDEGDSMYILINGLLHVVEEEGNEKQVVSVVYRGKAVGEVAILTGEKRSASVYAARTSDLVKLSKESFEDITSKYPQVMKTIARILIRRLQTKGLPSFREKTALNIAVLPYEPDMRINEFTHRLTASLAEIGPTLLLTSETFDKMLNKKGISQTRREDPRDPGLYAWLTELDSNHSFVLYQAEHAASPWTKRCLERADRVLLVADADASPTPGVIESELLGVDSKGITPGKVLVLLHPEYTVIPSGTSRWLDARDVETHCHVRSNKISDFKRLARILSKRAVGLALGGGAAKGLAHVGVIRALEEAGIPIDMIGGASMGSIIGAKYAMGRDYQSLLSLCKKIFIDINPFNEYTLPIISLLKSRKLRDMGKVAYGDTQIEDLWINFFCVSTNLTTSELVINRRGPVWKAVRTSSAVPGMIKPVLHNRELYVDGGVINNLPGDIIRKECGVLIVVDVNPKLDLSVKLLEIPSPWKVLWSKIVPFKKTIKVPNILDILLSAVLTGSYMTANTVKQVADISLTPPVNEVGFLDFKNMEKTADIGYRHTMEVLESLEDKGLIKALRGKY